MLWKHALLAAVIASQACAPEAQTPDRTIPVEPPAGAATPTLTPPVPAFKAGAAVVDRDGTNVGTITTVTEGESGAQVVIEIDGKLVGVPQETLALSGENAVSSQTKAEMLAVADAPP